MKIFDKLKDGNTCLNRFEEKIFDKLKDGNTCLNRFEEKISLSKCLLRGV